MTPSQVSFYVKTAGRPDRGRGGASGGLLPGRFWWVLLVGAWAASACSTPVFQYALENWPPDVYDLVLSGHGPLDAETLAAAEAAVRGDEGTGVNAGLRPRDDEGLPAGEARLTVRFPGQPPELAPVWTGAWSLDRLRWVLDSPLRRRLAEELIGGATAVFLFLPCGERDADAAARARLQSCLEELARTVELPPPDETTPEAAADGAARPAVRFPILDVSPDDPAEGFLRALLRASEPDLGALREPMAFPVFGRGRLLYAIVGGGINREVLAETCLFLTAACSCQVKAQNPGVDLLLRANWEQALDGLTGTLEELPPLTGLGARPEPAAPSAEPAPMPPPAGAAPPPPRAIGHMVWLAGAVLLFLLGGTLAVLLRRR